MAKKTFREKISGIADQALNGVKKAATHKTKITRELIMNPPISVGGLTSAQRYNRNLDKIFDKALKEGRGLVGNSGLKGHGVNSPAMQAAKNVGGKGAGIVKKAIDMGVTKSGHNKLLKAKYGKEIGSVKKYLKNFKFKGGYYE